jgi:hypothetical protein
VELNSAPPPLDEAEASQAARLTHIIQQSSKRHLWLERKYKQELDQMTLQLESEKAVNERLVSAVQVSAPIHTQWLHQSDVRWCTCSILLQLVLPTLCTDGYVTVGRPKHRCLPYMNLKATK